MEGHNGHLGQCEGISENHCLKTEYINTADSSCPVRTQVKPHVLNDTAKKIYLKYKYYI